MKRFAFLALGLGLAASLQTTAQQTQAPRMGGRRPPPREALQGGDETLTAAQQEKVKDILSKYDAATLTSDQARAIHEAFRQAGLRAGPALGEAIKVAGFDPEKLRELAPPPRREGDGAQGEDNREGPRGGESQGRGQAD